MKTFISAIILGSAFLLSLPASAIDLTVCQGGPQIQGGIVSCSVEKTITTDDQGNPLSASTFGIITSVVVSANLTFDPGKLGEYLQESQVTVPQQTINFDAQTNGSPITLSVTLAPTITIAEQDGKPVATGANLGVSSVTGSLPSWINNYIKKTLNNNSQIKNALISGANKGLSAL